MLLLDLEEERLFDDSLENDVDLDAVVDERWFIDGDWGPLTDCCWDKIWLVDPSLRTLGGGLM